MDVIISKLYLHNFLGNIVVHIQARYREGRMKTARAYSIWKKGDGRTDKQTDGRTTGGSASDKLCWLCQQRS